MIGASTLAGRLRHLFPADRSVSPIGLQLYTVREQIKRDFNATLQRVAEIGYKEVEFAGYFSHSPREV